MNPDQNNLYIIAGEMSGDRLGAALIEGMRAVAPHTPFAFAGVGGPAMADVGVETLFPMRDLSVMGFLEVLPRLPKLMWRIKQCVNDIIARQPRVVITIDSPGFCFRVVEKARPHCPNTKFIHYVAPQVWAWKPERAEKVAGLFNGLMCLLPFEPPFFEQYGLKSAFVGHPAVNLRASVRDERIKFFEKYDLSLANPPSILSLLVGSREGEVARLGPAFFEAGYRLLRQWPNLAILVPAPAHLVGKLKGLMGANQRFIFVDPGDRFQAFALSQGAIAASGTVGLELAMMHVPHVVAYKLSPITWFFARRLVKVPYVHLVNILLGRKVVPELLQGEATGQNLSAAALDLLVNKGGVADVQRAAFDQAEAMLRGDGGLSPGEQAAKFVLEEFYYD